MRVLVAEHDASAARLLESFLRRWEYEVATVGNLNDLWAAIYGQVEYGLLLLDWSLPALDGVRFCKALREHLGEGYMYVLLLTEEGQSADAARGLGAGADDYISKPYDARELRTRLHTGTRIVEMQRELATSHELEQYSMRDPHTGLWNPQAGLEILQRELSRARREGIPVAVIVGFIADDNPTEATHGPVPLGAPVQEALERLVESVRCYDSVSLYSTDYFCMVLPGCDEVRARIVADRASRRVRDLPYANTNDRVRWAVRMGIACRKTGEDVDGQQLVRSALSRLGQAREQDSIPASSPDEKDDASTK